MELNKENIIESLYKIMCSATSTVSDAQRTNNDYFKRRVLGFRAEIEFSRFVDAREGVQFFEGGSFISKKLSGHALDKNEFIYVTLATNESEDFEEIYSIVSQWDEVKNLFYVKTYNNNWTETEFTTRLTLENDERRDVEDLVLVPNYIFYKFNKDTNLFDLCANQDFSAILSFFPSQTRNPSLFPLRKRDQFEYFENYDLGILKNIYANRYFLDVVLRQVSGRQVIDLDGFLKINNNYYITEVKEKSPIVTNVNNTDTWQFGWDSRRILWYLYLKVKLNLPVLYSVREIDNREDRNFVQWDSIFLDDFLKGTGWSNSRSGGGGGDTVLAPYSFFRRLGDILEELL